MYSQTMGKILLSEMVGPENAFRKANPRHSNSEQNGLANNNASMSETETKYIKKSSVVFYLNEKIYNVRNLKLLTKVKFNHTKRTDSVITIDTIKYCRKIHKDMNKDSGVSQKTYKKNRSLSCNL